MGIAILATLLTVILVLALIAFWLERVDRRLAAVEKRLDERAIRASFRDLKVIGGRNN